MSAGHTATLPDYLGDNTMSHNAQRIASNVEAHGYRFAVAVEIKRFRRMGCSPDRTFALAMSNVFGRYVA